MRLSFPTLGQVDTNATADALALHQMRLHDKKVTAVIEISEQAERRILIVYAHGTQVGAYRIEGDSCQPLNADELSAIWSGDPRPVRVIPLPDMTGRLAYLACESSKRTSARGTNQNAWDQQLRTWKQEAANGLVEIASSEAHGFIQLSGGEPLENESLVISRAERLSPGFEPEKPETAWEAQLLDIDPASMSGQCLTLRRAAHHWSRAVFESYQNIAGEKFLLVMLHELQAQVRPWKWNIHVEQKGVRDEHFFPGADSTAHAYRAILMGMGAQMSFAIGGYLAQRILSEMFAELTLDERARLEAHRLIPAAFSE